MNIDDDGGDTDYGSRSHQTIDAIHDTAMTRNERAAVFRPETAFQRRFSEVTGLCHEGENTACGRQPDRGGLRKSKPEKAAYDRTGDHGAD